MNPASVPEDFSLSLDTVIDRVGKLPSLPAVVMELIQSLSDEEADVEQIACKISQDQALVAKILRLANSSFYGLQCQVDSVHDATVVLGLRTVRTLALAALATDCIGRQLSGSHDLRRFWRHSVCTAVCARTLAKGLRICQETAFIVGLLHDIGRLVLASGFPRHFDAVVAYRKLRDCHLIDAEHHILGINHARIGQLLANHWRFPPAICEAIASHHSSESRENGLLACVLHVADVIVHALDLNGEEQEMVPYLRASAWNAVGLSWNESQELLTQVEDQYQGICTILMG